MNQTGLSSSDNTEESAESHAEPNVAEPLSAVDASDSPLPPSTPMSPRFAPPTDNDDDEKDAHDRLTPAALVHAASGIQLHRVRNTSDLEKGDAAPEEDKVVEQLDKVLASVPPTLERQPAVPSQPGAFRAGGAPNDDESVMSQGSAPPATTTGLIEATLVEEGATSTAASAPIYKGQIVEEDENDDETAELAEHLVTLPKSYVRCFVVAFIILCGITIMAIFLVVYNDENSSFDTTAPNSSPTKTPIQENDSFEWNSHYWYENQPPEELWEKLENYTYVSHHMAIVSIINPDVSSINLQNNYGEANCTPVHYSRGSNSNGNTVMVTFTCGNNQAASVTTMDNGAPDTMILFHDADVKETEVGSDLIICRDSKHPNDGPVKYNEVVCRIPSATDSYFPFLFSCFSQMEEMAAVASVATHNLSVQCSVSQNHSSITVDEEEQGQLPEIFVKSPAAVVLSTQRLCRIGGDGFVLQNSLLDWRNLTDACSDNGMRLDVSDVPLCLSQSMATNSTYPLPELVFCPKNADACFGTNFSLPDVTVYDPWNGGEDATDCLFSHSVNESLVQKSLTETVYPGVPLINSSTLQQLMIYLQAQEGWVQEEVLDHNNT
jgi:hypothetical protein